MEASSLLIIRYKNSSVLSIGQHFLSGVSDPGDCTPHAGTPSLDRTNLRPI
jgi:hypothetical protein